MDLVFITHPDFLPSQSMPRYAKWVMDGMERRGHRVLHWQPSPFFYRMKVPQSLKKWLGYIDQYILFPRQVRKQLKSTKENTLFVFTDHALGPWVPLVNKRPHVIHCHDLLAQESAMGKYKENPTGFSGRVYQSYIRRGFQKGSNFISISKRTKTDLTAFLKTEPVLSEIVYNGLTRIFEEHSDKAALRTKLSGEAGVDLQKGFILHVGGNQWYKHRKGVIQIYDKWRSISTTELPLIMIGSDPAKDIKAAWAQAGFKNDIYFLTGKSDLFIQKAYAAASLLLFPSLHEGFGWPLVEAMASGCPVITVDAAPMNEIGAESVVYIPPKPTDIAEHKKWLEVSAQIVEKFIASDEQSKEMLIRRGKDNVKRFNSEDALDKIEIIYKNILAQTNEDSTSNSKHGS